MRRFVFVATLVLIAGVVFYFWPRFGDGVEPGGPRSSSGATYGPGRETIKTPTGAGTKTAIAEKVTGVSTTGETETWSEADFPIIAPLNAANSSIARDLDVVRQLFEAWQSNFPQEGNPVGENAEITAALMGNNRLELALVPKGHHALNDRGELCDRWGTPFRFHQLSGTRMEIKSAGPDRKFATDDDAVWTPQ